MEQVQILRIVVASPGDVQAERDVLETVAAELNRGIAAERGLRLEIARWETNAYPSFHPEGPQGLIDPILRIEDCDVLIGIFWKHFGTPTLNGRTGTEHEFHTAYDSWKHNRRPHIMVYFNQKAYTPRSPEETEQWGKVLKFQENFPQEGLWWPYNGKAKFERLVRNHLTQFLRQGSGAAKAPGREYRQKAAEHLKQARKKCQDGLQHAIRCAQQDEIDAEVIANFYATQAEVEWETSGQASQVVGCRCVAPYVAYAYVLSEEDIYSVSLYTEHVQRTMDWLKEALDSLPPDEAVALCQFIRKFWGRPALAQNTLRSLFSRKDWDRLRDYLFPKAPELVGTGYNADLTDEGREQITRLVQTMPRRSAGLRLYPLPETFTNKEGVAELLKKQLADEDDENGEAK